MNLWRAGENPGLSQRDWPPCPSHQHGIHSCPSAVLRKSLAIRDACLPASLAFSPRNNQAEEKSDRLRWLGTQDQVWFFSVSSPGYKAPTPVFIKGGDGGRGISGMLSMELCDPSNQKKVRDPLTVHSVLSVSFNVGHQSAGHFRAEQPAAWMTVDCSSTRILSVWGGKPQDQNLPQCRYIKGNLASHDEQQMGAFQRLFLIT